MVEERSRTDVYQIIVLALILLSVLVGLWMLLQVRNNTAGLGEKPKQPQPTSTGFTVPPPPWQ